MIVDENGNPWWIAKEVCDVLGLANVAQAVKHLDDDEKNSITLTDRIQRGSPKRTIINEPGLYNLIGKSTKPEAKLFSRWIAKEACDVLDLANVAMAVKHLDADEKNSITLTDFNRRGSPKRTIINEPGLYHLIAKSTTPQAKKFARWIRHDVLPSIRKTGSYSIRPKIEAPKAPPQQIPQAPKKHKEAVQHLLAQIEENEKLIAIKTDE
jgi:prophage antirepressor-like protein